MSCSFYKISFSSFDKVGIFIDGIPVAVIVALFYAVMIQKAL